MENCGIGWENRVLDAALSASAQVSGLPVTNLRNQQGAPSLGWRVPGTTATLTISHPPAGPWRAFGLFRTNLSATATWRIRTGSYDASWYGVDWISDWTGPCNATNGQCVYVLPGAITAERCEITITDKDNPDGYLSIPLAYAGPLWQPARNYSTESTADRNLGVDSITTLGGAEFVSPRWYQRSLSIAHQSYGDADAVVLEQILRVAATGQNILFLPDPSATPAVLAEKSLFGRLSGNDLTNPFGIADRHALTLTLTERL
ncbi:hypothetical protein [Acetobacter malorum]|uniref:Uncharacterized protein n=1 Tax=Acetobacter malorum TaxID=178901 RepID=A0A1Y3G4T2_9PROT|nr:hypothetical protein [Acetobacter malorum]OUJ05365.1 hypothetical protein HK23_06225 [Acetobacter malorum]